jgi:hypothetical protein
MRTRTIAIVALSAVAVLSLAACDDKGKGGDNRLLGPGSTTGATSGPSSGTDGGVKATASHDDPAGAMTGLLQAMRTGDNAQVQEWLRPEPASDRTTIAGTERTATILGPDNKMFWEVEDRKIVKVTNGDDTHADVQLDGYIVWCLGTGPTDAKASCAQPNGTGDEQTTTYPTEKIDGKWYVAMDINHGQLIHGNPALTGSSGTDATAGPDDSAAPEDSFGPDDSVTPSDSTDDY